MESISAGGERAKNGGDADEACSAAAAAAADAGAIAVLADRLCLSAGPTREDFVTFLSPRLKCES